MCVSPFLSIVTPTYNRAHLLPACFESLKKQTDFDFEWIIVDDGSTDNTAEIASGFNTDLFPVVYVHKENGGKHTALNASYDHIRGKYVLILDSDDYLTEDAVAVVRKYWADYASNDSIAMITLLRGHSKDDPLCTGPIANEPVDILRYKRHLIHSTDCCEVIRADVLKKYPFPVFEGERFLSECALWNRVALKYKCVYINEVIYICEYLEGGLTQSGRPLRIRNPRGGMYISNLRMGPNNYVTQRLKYGLLYCCYGFFAGLTPGQIMRGTEHKPVAALCLIPGWGLYHYWKHKYRS